jgi:hypothetical protein
MRLFHGLFLDVMRGSSMTAHGQIQPGAHLLQRNTGNRRSAFLETDHVLPEKNLQKTGGKQN